MPYMHWGVCAFFLRLSDSALAKTYLLGSFGLSVEFF